ncbi:hypothetical protein [Sphaerotilus sp.]|uniref:hypothetical protein n=1 Tax=Sphaerotilus sp. TaxID=2093942 RepID=UPI002ACDF49D|nr:hypothetical protein [Sphaerotilus sp.]MDZ7855626.1 hypothetical protein [Sphaerotilus sp.]
MSPTWPSPFLALHRTLSARQPLLTWFAWLMVACMVPAAGLLVLDDRIWRDVAIWAKPLKFMASTALFAATTAWCVGLLPEARRGSRTVRALVWTVVLTSSFEVGYISLQAALGEGSHHNVGDPLHAALFGLMAVAAVMLTATQAVLAWLIARHSADRASTLTRSVVIGLVLTFVLATVSGFLLGGQQPPAGTGLPLVGWHLGGPDARPAHFLGVHAQQLLPLAGWMLQQGRFQRPDVWLTAGTVGYVGLWAALMQAALA